MLSLDEKVRAIQFNLALMEKRVGQLADLERIAELVLASNAFENAQIHQDMLQKQADEMTQSEEIVEWLTFTFPPASIVSV
jgi:isocitrate dehydrogenase kinase/phosphatase